MAKISSQKTPYGSDTQTVVKNKKASDKDYLLCGIEIDGAANGIIVSCRYKLKPEAEKKNRGECYIGSYREPTKHIFEGYDGVEKFLMSEIAKLKADAKKG